MIEAIVEGGGIVFGLALLLYFEVIRPGRTASKPLDAAQTRGDEQERR